MTEPRDPSRIPPNPSRGANSSRGHRTASGESSSILCHAATPPHTFTTLRTWVLAYLGWLWLLAMQLPADATTLIPMNVRELAIRSSAAITGTVKRIEAAASDPKGPIFTYVFIDPEEGHVQTYLDSLDYDKKDKSVQQRSQEHHLAEFKAIESRLHKGSIVLIDDHKLPGGGKGKLVIESMIQAGWQIVTEAYQILLAHRN